MSANFEKNIFINVAKLCSDPHNSFHDWHTDVKNIIYIYLYDINSVDLISEYCFPIFMTGILKIGIVLEFEYFENEISNFQFEMASDYKSINIEHNININEHLFYIENGQFYSFINLLGGSRGIISYE